LILELTFFKSIRYNDCLVAVKVNFGFDIEVHNEGQGLAATLYTFRVHGREDNEFNRFYADPKVQEAPDFPYVMQRLERMLEWRGLYHPQAEYASNPKGYFRDEGDGASALWAPLSAEDREDLAPPYPSLRLYCFRIDYGVLPDWMNVGPCEIIVAGNGGVKDVPHPSDDPQLHQALGEIKYVRRRLKTRLDFEQVSVSSDGLTLEGDLSFEPEFRA
jgi:hypothetical protein